MDELKNTAKFSAIILFAIGTAAIYGWVFAYFQIPALIVQHLSSFSNDPTVILMICAGCFLIIGAFMDAVPAIIILAPLLQLAQLELEIVDRLFEFKSRSRSVHCLRSSIGVLLSALFQPTRKMCDLALQSTHLVLDGVGQHSDFA